MIRKVAHTLGSRLIIALLNMVLIIITAKLLGAETKGQISLFILNISLATMLSGVAGGPALVYLIPRHSIATLLMMSSLWSLVSVSVFSALLSYAETYTGITVSEFFILALVESLIATNLMILLGKNKISTHNILQVFKVLITVVSLIVYLNLSEASFKIFILSYKWSLFTLIGLSSIYLIPLLKENDAPIKWKSTLQALFKFGTINQIGSIAQFLNYRLSYYLLEVLISPPQLALIRIGVFSTAMQVSESLWHFTRSANTVQYSAISNLKNRVQSLALSIKLIKLNYSVTIIGILIIFLIPESFFTLVLGPEFLPVKDHFMLLSPGILALSFSGAINHFFAGVGDLRFNTINSIFGLTLALLLYYPSIMYFKTEGAAICTSLVYLFQASIQFNFLSSSDRVKISEILVSKSDLRSLKRVIHAKYLK